MKIAVTSSGEALNSPIDLRFGRARYFVVVDTDSGEHTVVDNEIGADAMQGAGIQAAESVSREGVEVLITGHCGPNAFRTLKAAGIEVVVGASGSVQDAVDSYEKGTLKAADRPDVEGHWM
jgi:predicted Fe-Mo cluster-binding NifX family protein